MVYYYLRNQNFDYLQWTFGSSTKIFDFQSIGTVRCEGNIKMLVMNVNNTFSGALDQSRKIFSSYYYHVRSRREDNVFTGVCLSTG